MATATTPWFVCLVGVNVGSLSCARALLALAHLNFALKIDALHTYIFWIVCLALLGCWGWRHRIAVVEA